MINRVWRRSFRKLRGRIGLVALLSLGAVLVKIAVAEFGR